MGGWQAAENARVALEERIRTLEQVAVGKSNNNNDAPRQPPGTFQALDKDKFSVLIRAEGVDKAEDKKAQDDENGDLSVKKLAESAIHSFPGSRAGAESMEILHETVVKDASTKVDGVPAPIGLSSLKETAQAEHKPAQESMGQPHRDSIYDGQGLQLERSQLYEQRQQQHELKESQGRAHLQSEDAGATRIGTHGKEEGEVKERGLSGTALELAARADALVAKAQAQAGMGGMEKIESSEKAAEDVNEGVGRRAEGMAAAEESKEDKKNLKEGELGNGNAKEGEDGKENMREEVGKGNEKESEDSKENTMEEAGKGYEEGEKSKENTMEEAGKDNEKEGEKSKGNGGVEAGEQARDLGGEGRKDGAPGLRKSDLPASNGAREEVGAVGRYGDVERGIGAPAPAREVPGKMGIEGIDPEVLARIS